MKYDVEFVEEAKRTSSKNRFMDTENPSKSSMKTPDPIRIVFVSIIFAMSGAIIVLLIGAGVVAAAVGAWCGFSIGILVQAIHDLFLQRNIVSETGPLLQQRSQDATFGSSKEYVERWLQRI